MKKIVFHTVVFVSLVFCLCLNTLAYSAESGRNKIPGNSEFENDTVKISVTVRSSVYKYEVTNCGSEPIVGFEICYHSAYNFKAPDMWKIESAKEIFHAWAEKTWASIDPNQMKEFSFRVSSKGAVLGTSPVKIQFESGKVVLVDNVWAPVKEPKSYTCFIASMIFVLAVGHSIFIIYKKRKPQETSKGS